MTPQNTKMLLGAVVAAILAFAVYYGLIGQQTATSIQNQANQTLGTGSATQPTAQPAPQPPTTQTQAPAPAPTPVPTPAPAPAPGGVTPQTAPSTTP